MFVRQKSNEKSWLVSSVRNTGIEAKSGNVSAKPIASEPDRRQIARIYEACHRFGIDDADEAVSRLERYDYQKGNDMVAWLRRMIDKMEFEVITSTLIYQDGVWGVRNEQFD